MECICCGGAIEGTRAKEHVLAQWLLEHLGIALETFYQQVVRADDGSTVDERQHATQSFVQGRVCSDCNGGWMSDLENQAKSIMIPLIDAKRSVFGLTDEERPLMARWAAKTAYLISYTAVQQDRVGMAHLRSLAKDGTLPASVCVAAAQHAPTGKASFVQKNSWLHALADHHLGAAIEETVGYKIGMQFGHLLLVVAHWPGKVRYLLSAGLHVPIWPSEQFYPSYYSGVEIAPDIDSRIALEHFSTTLAVIHQPPSGLVTIPQLYVERR
jgi:hypothetical protein